MQISSPILFKLGWKRNTYISYKIKILNIPSKILNRLDLFKKFVPPLTNIKIDKIGCQTVLFLKILFFLNLDLLSFFGAK